MGKKSLDHRGWRVIRTRFMPPIHAILPWRWLALSVPLAAVACTWDSTSGTSVDSGSASASDASGVTENPSDADPGPTEWRPCDQFSDLCDDDPVSEPEFGNTTQLVPSDGLPAEVEPLMSNNNLDAVWFDQRLFFAFRTASHHHPRDDAVVYIVSTTDLQSWELEHSLTTGEDLREPQLLVLGGRLLAYYTAVEPASTNFVPIGPRVMERRADGSWTDPQPVVDEGVLIWRINVEGGTAYLTAYQGLGGVLDFDNIEILWMKSSDGIAWEPAVSGQPVVHSGGGTESDIVFREDGSIVSVIRNDFGDEGGFGSKICRAPAGDLGQWQCGYDRRKYDSPKLFTHNEDIYLIGRRNITDTGYYDLDSILPGALKVGLYMGDYWLRPKRCSLWRVNENTLSVEFVLDLPSKGDTCFPEVLPLDDDQYLVFNYTSPLNTADDPSWRAGQNDDTLIYSGVLTLP